MNKIRRKSLGDIRDQLEQLKSDLEAIQQEEEEYRDSIPENLQGSTRFEAADDACSYLYDAVSNLEDAIENIESAISPT